MADFIGLTLLEGRKVTLRFEQFPVFAHDRLLAAMQDIEARLEIAVKAGEPRKSGRMLAQTGGRVYDHDTRIAAVVGVRATGQSDARKAMTLEYGSKASFEVRAHQMMLGHHWDRLVLPENVTVTRDNSRYSRKGGVTAKRFLRDPLDELRDYAVQKMQEAVDAAMRDANP